MGNDVDDVELILRRQDEAMALIERLRIVEPSSGKEVSTTGGGRRDFRRWPMSEGVTVELHDGLGWQLADCLDLGIGGARLSSLPDWVEGPVPTRLKTPTGTAILVLADVMWRDSQSPAAGLSFEFLDGEERHLWADNLIDALLAKYAVG